MDLSFSRASKRSMGRLPGDDVAMILFDIREEADFGDGALRGWRACHAHFATEPVRPGPEGLRLLAAYLAACGALPSDDPRAANLPLVLDRLAELRNGFLQGRSISRFRSAISHIVALAEDIEALFAVSMPPLSPNEPGPGRLSSALLSGTLSCFPALLPFQRRGMAIAGISGDSRRDLAISLADWMDDHADEIRRAQSRLSLRGMRFPAMKVIDLYFWTVARPMRQKDVQVGLLHRNPIMNRSRLHAMGSTDALASGDGSRQPLPA